MFEYLEYTADPRTFLEIVMTIWKDAEKEGRNLRGLKEDVEELLRRYQPLLEKVDNMHLGIYDEWEYEA